MSDADLPFEAAAGPPPEELLIDRWLPRFDTTILEHLVVDADVPTTWRVLGELDLTKVHTPLMDAAFRARELPARLSTVFGRERPLPPPPPSLKLRGEEVGNLDGWLSLGEVAGREIAFGAVGRFWQPEIEWYDVSTMRPEDFAAFQTPGWGRIAANFSLRPYGRTRTLASYEARTATPDPDSARRFRRYWTVIRPFVGHIMRAALNDLRDRAETEYATMRRSA
ncbi:hypothetical protein [Egicoccus sp. AB-alg2]|uniref:hypothetical protein n=1 Tax=Egicoccus sp. AB-alg2 TaxID=3242693 RepID=UPI00359E681C